MPWPRLPATEPMTVHTPIEIRNALPRWALGLTVLIFLVGGVYFAGNLSGENPPIGGGPSPSAGASGGGGGPEAALAIIQQAGCQVCHGPDLAGQGNFPNLHGVKNGPTSKNLQDLGAAHPDDWANLWIAGTDPEVAGLDRGGMPVFGEQLTPEQIETVVEYLKTLP
jgi:mono/diheme cytochrome c family protein